METIHIQYTPVSKKITLLATKVYLGGYMPFSMSPLLAHRIIIIIIIFRAYVALVRSCTVLGIPKGQLQQDVQQR